MTLSYASHLVPRRTLARLLELLLLKHCIQDIRQWMSQDKLLMNDAKMELLLIGSRQQLAKITIDGTLCYCSTISRSEPKCVVRF